MTLWPLVVASVAAANAPPAILSGVVVDERGMPVAGARVEATLEFEDGSGVRTTGDSGSRGSFAILRPTSSDARPPRTVLAEVHAVAEGGRTSASAWTTGLPARLTLRLRPAARLVVEIEPQQGELPAELLVRLVRERRTRSSPSVERECRTTPSTRAGVR